MTVLAAVFTNNTYNTMIDRFKIYAHFFINRGLTNIQAFISQLQEQYELWSKARYTKSRIRECDRRRDATNQQHYVLKERQGRLFVASSREIRTLKKAGVFQKRFNSIDLLTDAVYIAYPLTSVGLKKDTDPRKRRQFYKRIKAEQEKQHKGKKHGKDHKAAAK